MGAKGDLAEEEPANKSFSNSMALLVIIKLTISLIFADSQYTPFSGVWLKGGIGLCISFLGDATGIPSFFQLMLEGGVETGEISGSALQAIKNTKEIRINLSRPIKSNND